MVANPITSRIWGNKISYVVPKVLMCVLFEFITYVWSNMYKAPYQKIISLLHYITKLIESRSHFKEDVLNVLLHYLAHYGKNIHFGKPKIIIINCWCTHSFIISKFKKNSLQKNCDHNNHHRGLFSHIIHLSLLVCLSVRLGICKRKQTYELKE
jgi:hypothetical protein